MVITLGARSPRCANAVASICQRLGVEDAPDGGGPSLGLVRHMIQRPVWLLGFVIMAAGYGAQSVALHLGSLNEVQPLMVSELVMVVLLLWLWYDTRCAGATCVGGARHRGGSRGVPRRGVTERRRRQPSNARWRRDRVSVLVVARAVVAHRGSDRAPVVARALTGCRRRRPVSPSSPRSPSR